MCLLEPVSRLCVCFLRRALLFRKSNIFDNMIAKLEKYSKNLEEIVDERTDQLRDEKQRTDELLYQMLPELVVLDSDWLDL